MQSHKRYVSLPLLILALVMGIVLTVGSAQSSDALYSQYGGSARIVDTNASIQKASSMMNQFVIMTTLSPETIEVQAGDTVTWNNLQRPKKPVILVSDDDMWEPQTIYYGKSFSFTFPNTGAYTFSIEGTQMKGSVIVSEKIMKSVAEEESGVDTAPSMPLMVWNQTKNVTEGMVQTVTGTIAQLTRGTNEFLMIRTLDPTNMEVKAGETVTWHNLQRPNKPIVLVSKENMWEPQTIYYGKVFSFIFDTPGTYNFMLNGTNITGTIVVSESNVANVPESGEEQVFPSVPESSPLMVQNETKEQVGAKTGEMSQTVIQTKEFLMIKTIDPTIMEVKAGESVTWRNLQRPKMPIVVVSKEDLWKPQTIYYGKVFTYTFDKPGTYTFMLEGTGISGTVVVI
ncbi:cupredoxin domain-containing protein [uncultured Methanomethylovorans sp.]|uniref:cupredoxin domain-containing protein n=1 Tax=uncultured Methanomethylovorans sp. TaxID=183759 RepID=UPI002AA84F15|nr:cupredoxin domain-containing protein [uncultured Methanomethylovorans sp.]